MSELLHLCGEIDDRVRPFIFFIRRWAESVCITTKLRPSNNITNFQLSCLVLYFFQQLSNPILPPIDSMLIASPQNQFASLKSKTKLAFESRNTDTLEQLLEQFFAFYSAFDFDIKTISLNTAEAMKKGNIYSMHIVNPLDYAHNICGNVNSFRCKEFNDKSKKALDQFREMKKSNNIKISNLLILTEPTKLANSTRTRTLAQNVLKKHLGKAKEKEFSVVKMLKKEISNKT